MSGLASTRGCRPILLVALAAVWSSSAAARTFAPEADQIRSASEKAAAVTGKVEDPSGAVIVGAAVTLTPAGPGERFEATTDPKGVFRFESVPDGSYVLLVFRDGFAPYTSAVVIGTGEMAPLDVRL